MSSLRPPAVRRLARLARGVAAAVLGSAALGAVDGIAPVLAVPTDAAVLFPPAINAAFGADPPPALALDDLAGGIYWFDANADGTPTWVALSDPVPARTAQTAGTAGIVVEALGGQGRWQYRSGAGPWLDVAAPQGADGPALALLARALRFLPDAAATDHAATLVFRAWDGSGPPAGDNDPVPVFPSGSPGAVSAESRTLTVAVTAFNDPPIATAQSASVIVLGAQSGASASRPAVRAVADILATAPGTAVDPDGDPVGLLILGPVAPGEAAAWSFSVDGGATFQALPQLAADGVVALHGSDLVRYDPGPGVQPGILAGALTWRAWDPTIGGSPGIHAASAAFAGAVSAAALPLDAEVLAYIANQPPAITSAPPSPQSAIAGRGVTLDFTAADPDPGAALAWSVASVQNGGYAMLDGSGPTARFVFTPAAAGAAAIAVAVSDGSLASSPATVSFTVAANTPPSLVSAAPGGVAIAGQPWSALITAADPDAGDLAALNLATGARPAWLGAPVRIADGSWRLSGTAVLGQDASFTATVSDPSSASASVAFAVTVVSGDPVAVSGPSLPASTPGSVVYGAIHPGTSGNLAALSARVVALGAARARAFWWQASGGAFAELPAMPTEPVTAGVFLASLDALPVAYDAPPQAAPFAIVLPANSWSLIGIPPIRVDTVTPAVQSHPWDDFRLETAAGVPVDGVAAINAVLGRAGGSMADTRPWLWDGSTYARVATMQTGTAYWVRNRSGSAHRLVRAVASGSATFGTQVGGAQGALSAQSAADQPPPPPSGLPLAAAPAPPQGCGSGGLAGVVLLAAGVAGAGLRRRRRV